MKSENMKSIYWHRQVLTVLTITGLVNSGWQRFTYGFKYFWLVNVVIELMALDSSACPCSVGQHVAETGNLVVEVSTCPPLCVLCIGLDHRIVCLLRSSSCKTFINLHLIFIFLISIGIVNSICQIVVPVKSSINGSLIVHRHFSLWIFYFVLTFLSYNGKFHCIVASLLSRTKTEPPPQQITLL